MEHGLCITRDGQNVSPAVRARSITTVIILFWSQDDAINSRVGGGGGNQINNLLCIYCTNKGNAGLLRFHCVHRYK